MKRAPVIGNEHTSPEPLEEHERVFVREVATTESGLPLWGIADREQRNVELSSCFDDRVMHEAMCARCQGRIAGEEAALLSGIEQVHVRGPAPAVDAITIAAMRRERSMNRDVADASTLARRNRLGARVATPTQPPRDHRWGVEWNVARQCVERVEGEMVGVGVRDEQRVESGQAVERNTGGTHPRQKAAELRIEVGVGEEPHASDLEQQGGVPD